MPLLAMQLSLQEDNINLYPASMQTLNGEKWGYLNQTGVFQLAPMYDAAFLFGENGLACVKVGSLYGAIYKNGTYAVVPAYESELQFFEARAAVVGRRGMSVIDETGVVLTKKLYSYISAYVEGRAICAEQGKDGNTVYGYLNEAGQEIIPPVYEGATDFLQGKAIVKLGTMQYALINRNGDIVSRYSYPFVGNYGDGLLAFQEQDGGHYGFIDEAANVILSPRYTGTQPFQNGRAAVNVAEDYKNAFGLINQAGKFVILPIYNEIKYLSESRVAVGKAIDKEQPFLGSKYAVADKMTGQLLTDFIYDEVDTYRNGLASAMTENATFLIGSNGKPAINSPILAGSGSVRLLGTVLQGYIDQRFLYCNRFGRLIWKQSKAVQLTKQISISEGKYRPRSSYLVYYPQLTGMESGIAQEKVNVQLRQLSLIKEPPEDQQYTYSGDFSLFLFKKQLVILELTGYEYFLGAAHGIPTKLYAHINLQAGSIYELADLFKKNSNYEKVISNIIREKIAIEPAYSYIFPDSFKGIQENQPFYVTDKALYIYFKPYEIAPFAAGFPTFCIPFLRLRTIVNEKGAFWRSFH